MSVGSRLSTVYSSAPGGIYSHLGLGLSGRDGRELHIKSVRPAGGVAAIAGGPPWRGTAAIDQRLSEPAICANGARSYRFY